MKPNAHTKAAFAMRELLKEPKNGHTFIMLPKSFEWIGYGTFTFPPAERAILTALMQRERHDEPGGRVEAGSQELMQATGISCPKTLRRHIGNLVNHRFLDVVQRGKGAHKSVYVVRHADIVRAAESGKARWQDEVDSRVSQEG